MKFKIHTYPHIPNFSSYSQVTVSGISPIKSQEQIQLDEQMMEEDEIEDEWGQTPRCAGINCDLSQRRLVAYYDECSDVNLSEIDDDDDDDYY